MKRATIYLFDELKTALERTAGTLGKSEAEVIRTALAAATSGQADPSPRAGEQPFRLLPADA